MKELIFTRDELYNLVWAEPITVLLKKYQITDHKLRKICKDMFIPIPKSGYWSKMKFGKPVKIEKLPEGYKGKLEVNFSVKMDEDPIINETPLVHLQKQIENDNRLNLRVPSLITNPDKLIIAYREFMSQRKILTDYRDIYKMKGANLNINVNRDNTERALRFMDTLIKALRVRGHDIFFRNQTTYVSIKNEEIALRLKEKTKKIKVIKEGQSLDYQRISFLSLQIRENWHPIEFNDGKYLTIESQLPKILARIEMEGIIDHERSIQWKKEEDERVEKERIKKELEKRQDDDLAGFNDLINKAKRRYTAEMLRDYINLVEQKAIEKNSISEDLAKWIEWARKKADWYDPFVESFDELLNDIDRESLIMPKRSK